MIGFKFQPMSTNPSAQEKLRSLLKGWIAAQTINEESAHDVIPEKQRDEFIELHVGALGGEIDSLVRGYTEAFAEQYTPPVETEEPTVKPEV